MKLAYLAFPHIGGTFTVYRHLRAGLCKAGIDLRWVGRGEEARRALHDPVWAAERAHGLVAADAGGDERAEARALIEAILEHRFDGVVVNLGGDRVQTNAVRYLPGYLLRILVVHNITPGIYASARALRDHVHATVGVSPRITSDLTLHHGFDEARITTILNAVDRRAHRAGPAPDPGRLRLLSLGRVEDQAKGVLWLPDILARLPDSVTLTVAGDGPDLQRLRGRCAALGARVRFLGAVPPERAEALLEEHDCLIAPSRFEGLPMTVIEAMAAGCVPVTSLLRGVTDVIVEHGKTGMLFPVGDTRAAARAVEGLLRDGALLARMRAAGPMVADERFGVEAMASRYALLIERVAATRPPVADPLDIERWRLPPGLRPGLRSYLPLPVKNLIRTVRERMAS
ncbi:glycosyltransferase family 4 protein [Arenibaculum pallidiluteum]|uniref:glycosyltransferase family 4 protein n=1 Tax=Arenibaculum pallidiluteum TaxID=2812559 RepID=UPI001A96C570|nr:glycosyltransferase family 4 protein [Arenibaculum pallidiluteum]